MLSYLLLSIPENNTDYEMYFSLYIPNFPGYLPTGYISLFLPKFPVLFPDDNYNRQIKKFPTEKQNVSLKHILT